MLHYSSSDPRYTPYFFLEKVILNQVMSSHLT